MPTPFDMGAIIGPVLNEGSEDDFRMKLKSLIRNFMHSKPEPVNVRSEEVDKNLVRSLIKSSRGNPHWRVSVLNQPSEKIIGYAGKPLGKYSKISKLITHK